MKKRGTKLIRGEECRLCCRTAVQFCMTSNTERSCVTTNLRAMKLKNDRVNLSLCVRTHSGDDACRIVAPSKHADRVSDIFRWRQNSSQQATQASCSCTCALTGWGYLTCGRYLAAGRHTTSCRHASAATVKAALVRTCTHIVIRNLWRTGTKRCSCLGGGEQKRAVCVIHKKASRGSTVLLLKP